MPLESDVVIALNYYSPYVSGLTDVAKTVAEGLARRNYRVTVVTCRHDRSLPRHEMLNGVHVVRTRVWGRFGKGLISPGFIPMVVWHGRSSRVVNLHTPMIESGAIASLLRSTPLVTTYQCDIALPAGLLNRLQTDIMDRSNRVALRRAKATVPSSDDYAQHSRLADVLGGHRAHPIAPPTQLRDHGTPHFRETSGPHIGFLGRLVEEKGVEYLVDAFRTIEDPSARLLIAGDYKRVAGGSVVGSIREHMGDDPRIRLLGFLEDEELADFYASLDVFALPSVNSFEAFGIVQVEAMKVGIAALASDLPGVRQPVLLTGFGMVARPRDPDDIAAKLRTLLEQPLDREAGAAAANALYSAERTVDEYERLLLESMGRAR